MTKYEIKTKAARKVIRARPFSRELNWAAITQSAWDIQSDCTDVQWADDQLEDILGDELAGQFRLQYSDLSYSVQKFIDDCEEYYRSWTFDGGEEYGASFCDAMIAGSGGCDDLMMYDEGDEQEYVPLTGFVEEYHERMAATRIKALTKDRIIELMGDVIWLVRSYMDIKVRYELLSGIFELIREEACHELDAVKGVEEAWSAWNELKDEATERKLRSATSGLPDVVWLR